MTDFASPPGTARPPRSAPTPTPDPTPDPTPAAEMPAGHPDWRPADGADRAEAAPSGEPSAPEVSILVVSYNTRDMTLDCLRSIARETRRPHEVIVVDNASTDGSADAIAAEFPDVVLLRETTNHGFAAAHPIAVARSRAPWLLLLNPDTVVLDRAIDNLMAFARRRPDAGIWGGRTLYADGSLNPTSCYGAMSPGSVLARALGLNTLFPNSWLTNRELMPGWARDSEREVDIVTGCLFLIRRDLWDRLGGFDPVFQMYGEEADLCLRARALGARPAITPDATIIHHGGASDRVLGDKLVRLMKAKMELIRRHFPRGLRTFGRVTFAGWLLSRMVGYRIAARLTGKARHREHAVAWADAWARRREWFGGWSASLARTPTA